MSCPITIYKNNEVELRAAAINEAERYMAKLLKREKNSCFSIVQRGYAYNIPFFINEDEYRFIASKEYSENRRKELEKIGHKDARRIWMIPANPIKEYDVEAAFQHYEFLDWRRSYNYDNFDIIYIYVSGDVGRVRFKVEVTQGIVQNSSNYIYDERFWRDKAKFEESKKYPHSRFRLIEEVDTEDLSFKRLRENGLKGNIQGAMELKGDLKDYILKFFDNDLTESELTENLFANEVSETSNEGMPKTFPEGSVTTVLVNKYERNSKARKNCIKHYGAICGVCKINFEDTYGEVGKGFIHVHHIVPIHTIKEGYEVHPINDLRPVCPNCHSMLHRKENGDFLTIDQLQERILKRTL